MKDNRPVIARGLPVSIGQVTGKVKIVRDSADVGKVGDSDIMVVSHSSPAFAVGVMNSAGLVCEGGGMLTHICIVAREMGIPCLAQVDRATDILAEDMTVTLDAGQGVIYG